MIIFEGTDLVGKTTAAKKIEKHTGMLYRHLSRLPNAFHRYWGYLPLMNHGFVCDRLWLSEFAYCYARGEDTCPLSEEYAHMLCANMRLLGTVHVVITASDNLLDYRYNEARNEMYNLATIKRANEWFLGAHENPDKYDIDFTFHLTEEKPWLKDEALQSIVKLHEQKTVFLTQLLSAKSVQNTT